MGLFCCFSVFLCRERRAEGNYMYGQTGVRRRRQDGQTCGAALLFAATRQQVFHTDELGDCCRAGVEP